MNPNYPQMPYYPFSFDFSKPQPYGYPTYFYPNQPVEPPKQNPYISNETGGYWLLKKKNVKNEEKGMQTDEKIAQNERMENDSQESEKEELQYVEKENQVIKAIKQNLNKLLHKYGTNKEYNSCLDAILKSQENQQLKSFYVMFHDRIHKFRKSKEQMVKYIIRKNQRLYKLKYNTKKDDRFIKYGKYKSMNSLYMKDIFSDSQFSLCFDELALTFTEEFEKENDEKLYLIIKNLDNPTKQNIQKSTKMLSEKNKMPWPKNWKYKMVMAFLGLYREYATNDEDMVTILQNQAANL